MREVDNISKTANQGFEGIAPLLRGHKPAFLLAAVIGFCFGLECIPLATTVQARAESHQPANQPVAREPSFEGRFLSEWLAQYTERVWGNWERRASNAGFLAVRDIGTNAIPTLIEWLREPDTLAPPNVSADRSMLVGAGFEILGTNAAPAVPELARILNESNSTRSAGLAIGALRRIGKEGLPPLRAALENPVFPYRQGVAASIGSSVYLGTNLTEFVPLLVRCLSDTDERLVQTAIEAIGQLRLSPEISVPALTNYFEQSSNRYSRLVAIGSISSFGTSGRAAVPTLIRARKDRSDPRLQRAAAAALMNVAPEEVTNNLPFQ